MWHGAKAGNDTRRSVRSRCRHASPGDVPPRALFGPRVMIQMGAPGAKGRACRSHERGTRGPSGEGIGGRRRRGPGGGTCVRVRRDPEVLGGEGAAAGDGAVGAHQQCGARPGHQLVRHPLACGGRHTSGHTPHPVLDADAMLASGSCREVGPVTGASLGQHCTSYCRPLPGGDAGCRICAPIQPCLLCLLMCKLGALIV